MRLFKSRFESSCGNEGEVNSYVFIKKVLGSMLNVLLFGKAAHTSCDVDWMEFVSDFSRMLRSKHNLA
jgi:hypothetical protein